MKKSLRLQILIPFLALIVAASGVLTYLSYLFSLKQSVENSIQNTETLIKTLNGNLDMSFKESERKLALLTGNSQIRRVLLNGPQSKEGKAAMEGLQAAFRETLRSDLQLVHIHAVTPDKAIYSEPAEQLPADYDPTTETWYTRAIEHPDDAVWEEPYVDKVDNNVVVTVAHAVMDQGKLIGVIGIDIKFDSIASMINKIQIGDTGYALMMDQSNKFIFHKNQEMIGQDQSGEAFVAKMKENGPSGSIRYTFENHQKIMSYVTNETTGWITGGTVYTKEFEEQAQGIVQPMLIALGLVVLAAFALSWPVTQNIIRPVKRLQEAMKQFQEGKLSARSGVKRQNEIGKLAEGFDEMADQVGSLIGRIRQTSDQLNESSQILLIGATENMAASNEIAVTTQEIASGATAQASVADRNAEIVVQMAAQVETAERETDHMKVLTAELLDISQVNVDRMDELFLQTKQSVKMVGSVSEAITSLDACSEQIGGIVTVIADITNQTNLLALNAAIEAARAGEHGRGFGVVAGEVRKLAGHSEDALRQIQELVNRIRQETGQATSLSKEAGQTMQQQVKAVRQTTQAFASMGLAVERQKEGIAQLVQAVKEMAQGKDVISQNTMELQAICQTTAAGTEEVSASVEQQSASMEQLHHLAKQLEISANALMEEIKRFDRT